MWVSDIEGEIYQWQLQVTDKWLDSNFIPMESKKFGFRNFDYIEIKFESNQVSDGDRFDLFCKSALFTNIP